MPPERRRTLRDDLNGIIDGLILIGDAKPDLYVIELSVPRVASRELFFTQRAKCFIGTAEGTKRELTGLALVEETRQREREVD